MNMGLTNYFIPDNNGINLLVTDPALFVVYWLFGDHLPLSRAGHIFFMPYMPGKYQNLLL